MKKASMRRQDSYKKKIKVRVHWAVTMASQKSRRVHERLESNDTNVGVWANFLQLQANEGISINAEFFHASAGVPTCARFLGELCVLKCPFILQNTHKVKNERWLMGHSHNRWL